MIHTNNATIKRKELLVNLASHYFKGDIAEKIDYIPLEMYPKNSATIRCCIHKERAIVKYKLMALLGIGINEEEDELTPLSDYFIRAHCKDNIKTNVLTVIDQACSACVKKNYLVTDLCRGCLARPCSLNCPKKAIEFKNGKAYIDADKCVSCGICQKVCPYHAIVYLPVPCEEACPVGAIKKNVNGIEEIDDDKCIHCGKCMASCPFDAIMEKSQIIPIMRALKEGRNIKAMVAPAIMGQFRGGYEKILSSIKRLGFSDVVEVAYGADVTVGEETKEFLERKEEGAPFMTTSCCPSYVEYCKKHLPELNGYVSTTPSPMHFTAEHVKKVDPDCLTVFIGPCVGKRYEAINNDSVDYVMTFDELGAMFIAAGIEVAEADEFQTDNNISCDAHGFAISGGVAKAVKNKARESGLEIETCQVDGLNKKNIRLLQSFSKGKCSADFVEVMTCEGGCIAGPAVISNPKVALRVMEGELKKREG